MDRYSGLLVHNRFGYANDCLVPALCLGQSAAGPKRTIWLRLDQEILPETTPESIAETTWVIYKKVGEPAFILRPDVHRLEVERREVTRANISWLRENASLLEQIAYYHCQRPYPIHTNIDADAALYRCDFPTEAESALHYRFHDASLEEKVRLLNRFDNPVHRQLAIRLMGRNYNLGYPLPEYRACLEQAAGCGEPLLDYRGEVRLTPAAVQAKIETVRSSTPSLSRRQQAILSDLEQYLAHQFGWRGTMPAD